MRVTKEPETRKREIMLAAKRLFVSKGYGNTSINDIVNEVQVAKGLFYYYYPKKESLLDDIGDEYVSDIRNGWLEAKGTPQNLLTDLSNYLQFHLSQTETNNKVLAIGTGEFSPFSDMMNRRLIEVAVDHVFEIFEQYQTEFDPPLTYPKYAIRILIVGFADLYYLGVKDPQVYYVLLMEILGVKVKSDVAIS
ncbi:MAG: TetR/AcrR family transcriptional regulator [Clostridiaceae bacterium]